MVENIWNLESKLLEVEYFYKRLCKATHPAEKGFLLSAMSSAGYSISHAMQYAFEKVPGFDEWYEECRSAMKEDKVLRVFYLLRQAAQHQGIRLISRARISFTNDGKHIGTAHHFSVDSFRQQDIKEIPVDLLESASVEELCGVYFRKLMHIVADCYECFMMHCDPKTFFSLQNLQEGKFDEHLLQQELGWLMEGEHWGPLNVQEKVERMQIVLHEPSVCRLFARHGIDYADRKYTPSLQ